MDMTISEKIRVLLGRRGMTVTALAKGMNISRQYMTKKLKDNDFTVWELKKIAGLLGCDFEAVFVARDSGERI